MQRGLRGLRKLCASGVSNRVVGTVVCICEVVKLELLFYKDVFVFEGCVRLWFFGRRWRAHYISSGVVVSLQMPLVGALPCLCHELCVREDICGLQGHYV